MSVQFTGQGTEVHFSNDDFGTNDETVPCVTALTPPGENAEQVETTCIGSSVKTFVSSRQREMDEFAFTVNWDPNDATHALLDGYVASGVSLAWKIVIIAQGTQTQNTEISFSGPVTGGTSDELTAESVLTRNYVVKPSTGLTIATVAAAAAALVEGGQDGM